MPQLVPYKAAYTDPALDNFIAVSEATSALAETLGEVPGQLGLGAAERSPRSRRPWRRRLAGEVTVERSDVMRGVGRALAERERPDRPSERQRTSQPAVRLARRGRGGGHPAARGSR